MTAGHLRVLLHCPCTVAFAEVATALARAYVSEEIMSALRLGRLAALAQRLAARTCVPQCSLWMVLARTSFRDGPCCQGSVRWRTVRSSCSSSAHLMVTRPISCGRNEFGVVHGSRQGERGEQGDVLIADVVQSWTTSFVGGDCGAIATQSEVVSVEHSLFN